LATRYKFGYSADPVSYQLFADAQALIYPAAIYIVTRDYARLRCAQRIIGSANEALPGTARHYQISALATIYDRCDYALKESDFRADELLARMQSGARSLPIRIQL
jgi:hypothetical protein